MKGNRELDELLVAYILKELNTEDKAFVEEYINSNEKSRQYFEELRNAWRVAAIKKGLDKVDTDGEWEQFEQTIARERQKLVAVKTERPYEETALEEEKLRRRSRKNRVIITAAIAASVLAFVVLGWNFSKDRKEGQLRISKVLEPKAAPARVIFKHEINTSGKSRKLILQDGSEIILSDNSELTYQDPFSADRRDIILKGKADFKVAKDKARPFTVYSLGLSTSVLGTEFTVTAFEHAENTTIRLNEGKVVVRPMDYEKTKAGQEYYLLPGQELVYNNRNFTARLIRFNERSAVADNGNGRKDQYGDSPELPENRKGSWYMFNNQSLAQVFDELRSIYNTEIVYSRSDIRNLYFAGRFDKSDSLYTILSQIASLNNLRVARKNNKFIITR